MLSHPKKISCGAVALAMLLVFVPSILLAQLPRLGTPVIRNFSKDQYRGGTQNWGGIEGADGLIWIANNQGLLECDGLDWRIHALPNRTIVRSLARDSSGKIYAGGQSELGFFEPDKSGNLAYTSLLDRLPEGTREFEDVWKIILARRQIYFLASESIYSIPVEGRAKGGRIQTDGKVLFLGMFNDRIILQIENRGLCELKASGVIEELHPYTRNLTTLTALMPGAGNTIVISTLKSGLFLLDSSGVRPWETPESAYLTTNRIYTAMQLRDGRYAIGTATGGLVILNSEGELLARYTRRQGLQNNTVLTLMEDRVGNLWIGLDNGISLIAISSPFSRFFPDGELEGTAYAMQEFEGNLYCGTNNGLFVMASNMSAGQRNFELIPGTEGQVWSLQVIRGALIMGHHEGAFLVSNRSVSKLAPQSGFWSFLPLAAGSNREPERLIAGTYNGLVSFVWNGGWKYEGPVSGFEESSRFLATDPEGYLWIAHPYRGVWRGIVRDLKFENLRFLGQEQGLPSNLGLQLYPLAEDVVFSAERGTWVYNRNSDRFEAHPILDTLLGRSEPVRRLIATNEGNIWYSVGSRVGCIRMEDMGLYKTTRQLRLPEISGELVGGFEYIYDPPGPDVFFATDRGFIQYTDSEEPFSAPLPIVLLRGVEAFGKSDTLLFAGAGNVALLQTPELPARINAFRFSFSAVEFQHPERMTYSWKLEGFDQQWSAWSDKAEKEYTNLKPGDYVFRVRTQDINGQVSKVSEYTFRIAAPWYASTLAQIVYGITIASILISLVVVPQRRFAKDKAEMANEQERTLREQEERHLEQEANRSQEIMSLRNEKLQGELEFQSGQLANTTLHLVQKNALIVRLREDIEKLDSTTPPEELKKSLRQLLGILNNDDRLDEDWEHFAIHFDKVHADFLARLRDRYPQLTPRDHKLCAFLRMNLSSKEIAPLLYISVRGVEISRYRLRKKLELEAESNLTEFLLGI